MAGEAWTECTVDEIKSPTPNALATGPFGSAIGSRYFADHGVPVIRGGNLSQDVGVRLSDDGLVFVSDEKAREFSRSLARRGDLVFTCWGTIDQVGLVDDRSRFPEYVVSNKQMKLTPDPRKASSLFLYYLFSSPLVRDRILNQGIGSSVPGFNLGQLRSIRLNLPALPEQRAIAHILGTLDDKIELNRRMNETLEAMARALFKSWFVEKVQDGLPKGWRDGTMDELVTLCRDTINPSEFPNETFDHYSIPAFDEGRLAKAEAGEQILSNKFLVPSNAIMISKLNPRIPRVWFPQISNSSRSVSSTEFLVAVAKHGISREWLYGLYSSDAFLDEFATFVTGTSGSHQRVKPEYLLAMGVDIPPEERITGFTALAKPLHDRIALNRTESRTLAALRDTLLPNLISGELRVQDVETVSTTHHER